MWWSFILYTSLSRLLTRGYIITQSHKHISSQNLYVPKLQGNQVTTKWCNRWFRQHLIAPRVHHDDSKSHGERYTWSIKGNVNSIAQEELIGIHYVCKRFIVVLYMICTYLHSKMSKLLCKKLQHINYTVYVFILSFKGRGSCPKTPIPRLKQLAIWRVWGSVEAKPGSILSNLADLFGTQGKFI